jgi:DNA-binding transcriptional LysR family regulator
MEIQHVRHFLAAAEAGNMTRAAEQLGIAQPALSQSLRRMEEKLGVKLINRSRRGITLNPVGQAILDDLREALAHIDAASKRAQQISEGLAGTITLGFTVSAVFEVLPRALRMFKQQSPDVRIVLKEMPNTRQLEALEREEIDIGILYAPPALPARVRQQVLARYRLVGVVHDRIRIAADGTVSLRELAREGLVMFEQDQVPLLRGAVLQALVKLDEEYRVVQEVENTLTALGCVATGIGVSLLPSGTRSVQFPGVRYCEIREKHLLPALQLAAVWPARSKPTIVDRFAKVLKAASAELAR